MKGYYSLKSVLIIIVAVSIWACQKKEGKPENFDFGSVENCTYSNAFFHFTVKLPESWNILPRRQAEEQQAKGMEIATGSNKNMNIESYKISTANLFSVYQYPFESATGFNASLISVAEKVSQTPSIKTSKDYLEKSRKVLMQAPISFDSIDRHIQSEDISGRPFSKMDVVINGDSSKIFQTYYCLLDKGFAVCFILSYINLEQQQTLSNSMRSINFE